MQRLLALIEHADAIIEGFQAVGAFETEFRLELLRLLGLGTEAASIMQADANDPDIRRRLPATFKTRSRAAWQKVFDGTDACVSPVLHMDEVLTHEQNAVRDTFGRVDGVLQPNPAPRFSRTQAAAPGSAERLQAAVAQLDAWGLTRGDAGDVL